MGRAKDSERVRDPVHAWRARVPILAHTVGVLHRHVRGTRAVVPVLRRRGNRLEIGLGLRFGVGGAGVGRSLVVVVFIHELLGFLQIREKVRDVQYDRDRKDRHVPSWPRPRWSSAVPVRG